MPEKTDFILEQLAKKKLNFPSEIRKQVQKACFFLDACRIGTPKLHLILLKIDSGYGFYPVVKIRLKLVVQDQKRDLRQKTSMVKTVYPGIRENPVFVQILTSFDALTIDAFKVHQEITEILGRDIYQDLTQTIAGAYNNYVNSSRFEQDHMALKNRMIGKLRSQLYRELHQKFQVMIAMGEDESTVTQLFRQAEIERVIRS